MEEVDIVEEKRVGRERLRMRMRMLWGGIGKGGRRIIWGSMSVYSGGQLVCANWGFLREDGRKVYDAETLMRSIIVLLRGKRVDGRGWSFLVTVTSITCV